MTSDLPCPPFYEVPNLNNLRDAALACGGLKTRDGRSVRGGVLFRSAEVSKVDEGGWRALKDVGVSLSLVLVLVLVVFGFLSSFSLMVRMMSKDLWNCLEVCIYLYLR